MRFFKLFIAICSGPAVFAGLARAPLYKAIVHFLLLTLICSSLIATFSSFNISSAIDSMCSLMEKNFGKIVISGKAVLPSEKPETGREFIVRDKTRVTYIPGEMINKELELDKLDAEGCFKGIVWTPGIIFGWLKVQPDKFMLLPLLYRGRALFASVFPKKEIGEFVKKQNNPALKGNFNIPETEVEFTDFAPYALIFTLIMIFIGFFAHIVFTALVFTGIFSLMYLIAGKNDLPGITLQRLYVIALYAGFPGVVIGSMFPAFSLPFFSYQTVYLVCLIVYLMVIFNFLKKLAKASQ